MLQESCEIFHPAKPFCCAHDWGCHCCTQGLETKPCLSEEEGRHNLLPPPVFMSSTYGSPAKYTLELSWLDSSILARELVKSAAA